MPPLLIAIAVALVVCAVCWVASLITKDTSWVDRIWSVVPVAYVWIFAAAAGLRDPRLDVMAVLVTLWGARLTFNFARKGGYAGVGGRHEDYRWAILRDRMSPVAYQFFNFFFIVLFQNAVLLLIALPAFTAFEHRTTAFGVGDVVLTILFLAFLTGETVADQQQWTFQEWKRAELAAGREPSERFVRTGLWRLSRHPNFFFENAQWWVIFLFGAVAAGSVLQWTVAGIVLLLAVFLGSTNFTETISKAKYPEYAEFQRATSAVIPWFPRRSDATSAGPAKPQRVSR
jgi:steroid 5-alpha reductase family enzyme